MNIHLYLRPPMRLRDEYKINTIRQKAIEMIVREGFDGMSMQKLAKAAHVSPATIYIYFENREDLLNQIFLEVQRKFIETALQGFNPNMSFKEGLWLQWVNRLNFITHYPAHFKFQEQFAHSPLIQHKDIHVSDFKESMKQFAMNAIKNNELKKMEPEIYWSIAYGSFYSLVKFHLQEKTMMGNNFRLTEEKLKQSFDLVLKALKP